MARKKERIIDEDPKDLTSEELDIQIGEIQKQIISKKQEIKTAEKYITNINNEIIELESILGGSKTVRDRGRSPN